MRKYFNNIEEVSRYFDESREYYMHNGIVYLIIKGEKNIISSREKIRSSGYRHLGSGDFEFWEAVTINGYKFDVDSFLHNDGSVACYIYPVLLDSNSYEYTETRFCFNINVVENRSRMEI